MGTRFQAEGQQNEIPVLALTHSRILFFLLKMLLHCCVKKARKNKRGGRGSRHNEIRSHIDKYQRTGVTGFFCTHRYFEKTASLVAHGHAQQTRPSQQQNKHGAFSKKICKLAEKDRMQCQRESRAQ